jgi:serine/threonine protein kinase
MAFVRIGVESGLHSNGGDEVLSPGTRLGGYVIGSRLGAGGMGEVYRATDTRLGRDVAIKVLPDAFAVDSDRIARIGREARALAALNHPNVALIYGLEDAGGSQALVLELVEGPTLADRLAPGPLQLDEALGIANQIAGALDAAHSQRIIHRDLKPANIKVRDDGTVKVLDFGLAKALDAANGTGGDDLLNSPTITSPAETQRGVILGTAAYMSPEQARGKPVDHHADIWAFGCVLYEMLTGKPPFGGEGVTDTLGAVLHTEPDWDRLDPAMPARIRMCRSSWAAHSKRARHRPTPIPAGQCLAHARVGPTPSRPSLAWPSAVSSPAPSCGPGVRRLRRQHRSASSSPRRMIRR